MLVGREQELYVLNDSFRRMQDGNGSVLFITGEAGLGKTTLIHEWWEHLSPSAIYTEAACSIPIGNVDVGTLEALQPWADIVAQMQAHEQNQGSKNKLDFKKLIHDAAPAWAWAIPVIGDIAHAAVETTRLVRDQQQAANANAASQQQVFQQYVNLITKVSEEMPLVILLDDMHWADASSSNLLFYLSRQIADKKIFVIVTYRPDDAQIANDGKGHPIITVKNEILRYDCGKEMSLGYLDGEAIRELLGKTFPEYHVDNTLESWLRKISDGNSLFVTQFIRTLQEDGHLNTNGSFTGDYETIAIPDSALAVVTERTRRLDDATRELLSYATAEGEEFTSYVLGQLTSRKPLELLRELRRAEAAGLVQSRKGMRQFANQTTSVFGFSHALFHKALYDGLLSEEREILHRQCYDILKAEWDRLSTTKERTMPLASKLLTHAEKCGEFESGVEIAMEAAKGAWEAFSGDEAMKMLETVQRLLNAPGVAFTAAKRDELTCDAALLRTKILFMHGHFAETAATATEALEHAERLKDNARITHALNERSNVLGYLGKLAEAEADAQRALALAGSTNDTKGTALAHSELAKVYSLYNRYEDALAQHKQGLALWEALNDQHGIAVALNNIGVQHSMLGASTEALQCYEKSMEISKSLDSRYLTSWSLGAIGQEYHNIGEDDKALDHLERAMKIMDSIGNVYQTGHYMNALGGIYEGKEMLDKALEYYLRSAESAKNTGTGNSQAAAMNNAAQIYYKRKDFTESRDYLEQARAIARECKSRYIEAYSIGQMGMLADAEADAATDSNTRKAKLEEAVAHLEEAVAVLREIKHRQAKDFEKLLETQKEKLQK